MMNIIELYFNVYDFILDGFRFVFNWVNKKCVFVVKKIVILWGMINRIFWIDFLIDFDNNMGNVWFFDNLNLNF